MGKGVLGGWRSVNENIVNNFVLFGCLFVLRDINKIKKYVKNLNTSSTITSQLKYNHITTSCLLLIEPAAITLHTNPTRCQVYCVTLNLSVCVFLCVCTNSMVTTSGGWLLLLPWLPSRCWKTDIRFDDFLFFFRAPVVDSSCSFSLR